MATIPTRPIDEDGDSHWLNQHTQFVCQSREREPDVVFIGDSIIQQMQFTQSWQRYIEPLHALNFGIYGDATQHLLWRLQDGELDGINVKAVVLCVGSHNRGHSSDEMADGIQAVITAIRTKLPNTALIVLGLLPCGREPNEKRARHKAVNQLLLHRLRRRSSAATTTATSDQASSGGGEAAGDVEQNSSGEASGGNIVFLNPDWEQLIQPNGLVSHRDMYDYMHLTEQGFAKIFEPILEELQNCLQTFMKTGASTNDNGAVLAEAE